MKSFKVYLHYKGVKLSKNIFFKPLQHIFREYFLAFERNHNHSKSCKRLESILIIFVYAKTFCPIHSTDYMYVE